MRLPWIGALAVAAAAAAFAEPVSYELRLTRAGEKAPARALRVDLDGRVAWTDAEGVARFDWLPGAGKVLAFGGPDWELETRAAGPGGVSAIEAQSIRRCDVEFTCVVRGTQEPAVGAVVRLDRADGRVAMLPLEGSADWAGKVAFRGLPAGKYRMTTRGTGFTEEIAELEVRDPRGAVALAPPATESTARIEGTSTPGATVDAVRFSRSDAALLPVASTVCAPDGRFSLDIPTRTRGAGASPLRTVLRFRAPGHRERFVPVRFPASPVHAPLPAEAATTREAEPNGTVEQATAAPETGTHAFGIGEKGDRDVFAVDLPGDGLLRVRMAKSPAALTLRLRDAHGVERDARSLYAGQGMDWAYPLRGGRWYLEWGHWGDAEVVPAVEAAVTFEPATDPQEPNEDGGAAAAAVPGTEYWGAIFPPGDRDAWRIRAERGTLRVRVPKLPVAMSGEVRDARGRVLGQASAYAGQDFDLVAPLEQPGAVTVVLTGWGDGAASVEPYRVRFDLLPADGGEGGEIPLLPLDGFAAGTLNPSGDRDAWSLDVRESGALRIRTGSLPLAVTVRVLDPAGRELAVASAYAGQALETVAFLPKGGMHRVELASWGAAAGMPTPVLLQAAFFPNDSWDARRNETFDTARRISLARTVTGALVPEDDVDVFRFIVPRRAIVTATLPRHTTATTLRLHGPDRKELGTTSVYAGQANTLVVNALEPGMHWVSVSTWGKAWAPDRYRLNVSLDFEDPLEPNDRPADARPLPLSTRLPGTILPAGDVDMYVVDCPDKGPWVLHVTATDVPKTVTVTDGAGKTVATASCYGGQAIHLKWESGGAQRVHVRVERWGAGPGSAQRHSIRIGREGSPEPPAATLTSRAAGPRTAELAWAAGGATAFGLDTNGDGVVDADAATAGAKTVTWARGGIWPALVRATGPTGTAWDFVWVDARDPADEPEVEVEFLRPSPGAVVDADLTVDFDAWARDGGAVTSAELFLGDRLLGRWNRGPCSAPLSAADLAGRSVKLRVVARGERGTAEAALDLSGAPIVNLSPPDGTRITSGRAIVTWDTAVDGPSEVVVAGDGVPEQVFRGQAGRHHVVTLDGLPAGKTWSWRPRSGDLTAAPRLLHTVRGLAFAERAFEAKVERDYDQKCLVRVVNNGDRPATLTLRVVSEQKDLLVGFVGEGTPEKRVDLDPAEFRDVALGISAQDATEETYRFHVSLEGISGNEAVSDAAPVTVHVRMPRIDFEVTVGDADPGTLARAVTLVNKGETISDLSLVLDGERAERAVLTPAVSHARLEAGRSLNFVVSPHLEPGWTDFDVALRVRGVHVKKEFALAFALPPGKRIFRATVHSRQDNQAADWVCTNRPDVSTAVSVPAGPQIGAPVDIWQQPAPPPPEPLPPPAAGSAEALCQDLIAMIEALAKDGGIVPVWDPERFWNRIDFAEGHWSGWDPNRRSVGYWAVGKHLDTEDGGTDFDGKPFKPIRTGYEVDLYRSLKTYVTKSWLGPDGKPVPLTPAKILEMALRVAKDSNGTSNVPLAMLTAHNLVRILARAEQWDGPGMPGDYGHGPNDAMWPILQDLRDREPLDGGTSLPRILNGMGIVKDRATGTPGSWSIDLFDSKGGKPLFSGLPGSDDTKSLNGGSHYYMWVGMIARGIMGRTMTSLGIVKEIIVKIQMGDGDRGGKEGGYADKGKEAVICLMNALERIRKEHGK